jgi:hypothetical protein
LIENNRNLILFYKVNESPQKLEIHGDEDGERILPEAGNEDGKHFRLWGKEW